MNNNHSSYITNYIKQLIHFTFITFLNPVSPIATLLVGWLLTIYATPPSSNLPIIVVKCLENKNIIISLILGWLLLSISSYYYREQIDNLNKSLLEKETIIKQKNEQLQNSSAIIMNKYGEFHQFKTSTMFYEILQEFVNNIGTVDSAQIYSYSISSSKQKNACEQVIIKLQNVAGYAYEGIDINQILQTYYPIDKEYYDQFRYILTLWKIVASKPTNELHSQRYLKYVEELDENMAQLFNTLSDILNQATIDTINEHEEYYNFYRMLTVLHTILFNMNSINKLPDKFLTKNKDKNVESFLNNGKRTGILGAILLEDLFIFRHSGPSSKHGRIYVSFPIEFQFKQYCILLTISPNTDYNTKYFDYMRSKFLNILKFKTI